jgi:hypothetical protein
MRTVNEGCKGGRVTAKERDGLLYGMRCGDRRGLSRARAPAALEWSKQSARDGGAVAKDRDRFCAEGGTVIGAR